MLALSQIVTQRHHVMAGCSQTTSYYIQACRLVADTSFATCMITDKHQKKRSGKTMNYPMKKPKSFCSRKGTRLSLGDEAPDARIAICSFTTYWGWRKHLNSHCVQQYITERGDERRCCPVMVSRSNTVPQCWYVGRITWLMPSCHTLGTHCCHCPLLYRVHLMQKGPFTLTVAHFQHLHSELQALSPKPCYTKTSTAWNETLRPSHLAEERWNDR